MDRKPKHKVVNDPIHGHIVLPELCVRIIDTVQFQRLRHIKQLGGCYLVYPGATHTRFEHSLGVCHLAGTLIRHLRSSQPELNIDDGDVLCVQVAGLCHDLGHGPFSHLFEIFMKTVNPDAKWKHEDTSKAMLKHLIEVNGIELEKFGLKKDDLAFIQQLLKPPQNKDEYIGRGVAKPFLYQIVANEASGIDVDKWDYFARDCHHLGMSSMFDHKRLTEFSGVIKSDEGHYEISYRDKEVQNIYEMFHIRQILHRKAYQHKTNKAAEEMIMDAFKKADDHIRIWCGRGENRNSYKPSECYQDMAAYEKLTDHLYQMIQMGSDPELEESQDILQRIAERHFYPMAGAARVKEGRTVREEQIKNEIGTMEDLPYQSAFFVRIVKFSYGKGEHDDPVTSVKFFNKQGRLTDVRTERESYLLPKLFQEQFIRIYCRDEANVESVRRCFENWCDRRHDDVEYIKIN